MIWWDGLVLLTLILPGEITFANHNGSNRLTIVRDWQLRIYSNHSRCRRVPNKARGIITMAAALESKSKSLTKNGVLMIGLGTTLCALGSLMARPMNEQLGYLLAEVLTALCLLLVCASVGIRENNPLPQRLSAVYLAAGAASIVCCLIFWLVQSASADLRLLGILAGLHGLVWGAWYLRLAFQFQSNSDQAAYAGRHRGNHIVAGDHTCDTTRAQQTWLSHGGRLLHDCSGNAALSDLRLSLPRIRQSHDT